LYIVDVDKLERRRNTSPLPYVYMTESGNIKRPMAYQTLAQPAEVPLHAKNDEVLITLVHQGEQGAYRILVERYQERIRNLIYSIFHEREIVDDLSQEVFIKAYQALPQFRFQSSFYTWLYRIAVNKSRDELRKRKVRRWFSLQTMMENSDKELGSKIVVEPQDHETQEILAAGLQSLPEKYRLAIVLKDIDGLSYEEIAEIMECELGTVKSRLSRARSMLRKVLEPLLKEGV
jgi:RNA polymerase sigma-70 factor, ECF subfamily